MPLADTQAIAFMLGVKPGTVRSWASRGHLKRRGTAPDGRALYDVDEAGELAERLGGDRAGRQLNRIETKVDLMTEQQGEINTDVQAIEQGVAALGAAAAAIQAEIDALKQANPALDLSGLDKAAADLTGAVGSVQALAPPAG